MRPLAAALAAAMLVRGAPAMATDIDLSTWTCQQFASASKDDIGVILAWLDGYYKDEDDPPVIDTTKFVDNAKKLGEYCSADPTHGAVGSTRRHGGVGPQSRTHSAAAPPGRLPSRQT